MARHHLREDKTCLNCGFTVEERFCSRCGQENIEPKESFGHLVGHFFADITHFDSKFFMTVKDLVWKPGFLTKEYAEGRRMRYLNPIRMYVFISAIFFLVIYWGSEGGNSNGGEGGVVASGKDTAAPKVSAEVVKPGEESFAMHFS